MADLLCSNVRSNTVSICNCLLLVAVHTEMPARSFVHFHGFWVNALVSLNTTSRLMEPLPQLGLDDLGMMEQESYSEDTHHSGCGAISGDNASS